MNLWLLILFRYYNYFSSPGGPDLVPSYVLCHFDAAPPCFERLLRERLSLSLHSAISAESPGPFRWRMAFKRIRRGLSVCCYCVVAFGPSQQPEPGNYICKLIDMIIQLTWNLYIIGTQGLAKVDLRTLVKLLLPHPTYACIWVSPSLFKTGVNICIASCQTRSGAFRVVWP